MKGHHYWWSLSSIISLVAHPFLPPSLPPFVHPLLATARPATQSRSSCRPRLQSTHLHSPRCLFSLTVEMEGSDFIVKVSPPLVIQLLPKGPSAMLLHTVKIFLRCKQRAIVWKTVPLRTRRASHVFSPTLILFNCLTSVQFQVSVCGFLVNLSSPASKTYTFLGKLNKRNV